MNHVYIEENNMADLYVMGKLTPGQQALFEQHFINCTECVELLEEIRVVRQALQIASLEEVSRPTAGYKSGFLAIFSPANLWRRAIIFGFSLLLLAAIPVVFLVKEVRRLRHELSYVESNYVPAAEQAGADSDGEKEAPALNQSPASQQPRNTDSPADKQPRRVAMLSRKDELARPQANTPIFVLSTVSRAGHRTFEPLTEVVIDRRIKMFVFSLELEAEQHYEMYRARILTSDKRAIWSINKLRPNRYGALTIGFDSNHFQEGNYLLALEGCTKEGQFVLVANCPFRVIIKKPKEN